MNEPRSGKPQRPAVTAKSDETATEPRSPELVDGFVHPSSELSPNQAFRELTPAIQKLVRYEPRSLWELDTARLPGILQQYRRTVRDYAERELAPLVERGDQEHDGGLQIDVLRSAARAGFLSDMLPKPIGSTPLLQMAHSLAFQAVLKMEELCTVCGGLGLLIGAHALGTMPLILSGDWRVLRDYVVPMFRDNNRGEVNLMAFAITEPAGGSDVEDSLGARVYRPGCVAKRVGGGYRLSGRKVFISGGDLARGFTVFAALEGEGIDSWTCFLVLDSDPGFQRGRNEMKMGQRASAAAELIFDDLFVPDARVIGGPRGGWALNRATLNISRTPVGAIALGIARGAMESAIRFARRTTFGDRRLLDYQEVQLQIAQMVIDTSAMRAMVWQYSRPWVANQALASATKVFCSDSAVKVCKSAMELMGDHGFVYANRAEKAYRDARLTQIYEGTNQINRLAIIEDQLPFLVADGPDPV